MHTNLRRRVNTPIALRKNSRLRLRRVAECPLVDGSIWELSSGDPTRDDPAGARRTGGGREAPAEICRLFHLPNPRASVKQVRDVSLQPQARYP